MIIITCNNGFELTYYGKIDLATSYHDTLGPMLLVEAYSTLYRKLMWNNGWDCKVWDSIPFSQIAKIIGI